MKKKTIRKIISLVLCLTMILSISALSVSAFEKRTDCDENCELYPTIIVPGLGQSNVWVLDENGDYVVDDEGNKTAAFPAWVQLDKVIKAVALPLIASLTLQRDMGLSDALAEAIGICFGINSSDGNGNLTGSVVTEKYPYSLGDCSEYEKSQVYHHVPFDKYNVDYPEDHLYYFAYNSFGNHLQLVDELYDYIEMVKEQTGHDKVNLVPLSQGGTLTSGLIEYYPEISDSLHKIIFVVPALDGSTIIGDVFNGRVEFLNPDFLYNGFLSNLGLLDGETARTIEVLLRIFPDEVLVKALEKAVDRLVNGVMKTSTNLWALCPSGDYPTAADRLLSEPGMEEIRRQTDIYYQTQLHCHDNIKRLVSEGVQVFCFAEYDYAMIDVGSTWNTQNADFIIQLDSTAMGVHAANVGETLPEDYVQQNTFCSTPGHNHISPDRVVDASTGLLPDTTFYFDSQRHDLTAHNDVILKLAISLLSCDEIKDVYSDPDFPQFNYGRDVRNTDLYLEEARSIDTSALSAENKAELKAAIEQAEFALSRTAGEKGELEAAEKRLKDILVTIGSLEAERQSNSTFFTDLSIWLYDNFGTDGFSEMPKSIIGKLGAYFKQLFLGLY